MIEITVRPDHVTVNGHARHGPPGEDIVCAAVSALTQTLLYYGVKMPYSIT